MNIDSPADVGVPAADSAANLLARDVGGNKADALVEVVGVVASVCAMVKGLIQKLAQGSVARMTMVSGTSSSLADVLNITDKGILTGIVQLTEGADDGRLTITVDGTVIYSNNVGVQQKAGHISLPFYHRFDTSLRVQHSNVGNSVQINTFVMYTTD